MEYPQRDFNHISDISENYNSFPESVTNQILEKDKLNHHYVVNQSTSITETTMKIPIF